MSDNCNWMFISRANRPLLRSGRLCQDVGRKWILRPQNEHYCYITVQVITWKGRCEQSLFQLRILRGFCELSRYWPLCCHWTTVRSRHHFALHLRLIYATIQYNASNFTAPIKSVLLWSQSIVKSWWPTQVFRFITLRGFCEPSVYWLLCRHWSSQ